MDDPPKEKLQEAVTRESEALKAALSAQDELVFPLLKFHLLTEQFLERIIASKLPHREQLVRKGRLQYFTKLLVVDALGVLDSSTIAGLEGVNALRNQLAHKDHDHVTRADLEAIAARMTWPSGVGLPPISEHFLSLGMMLVFSHVYGPLVAAALEAEGISRSGKDNQSGSER